MNKEKFLTEIASEANLTKEEAILVSDVLDDNFFLSKSNKEKTISGIMNSLNTGYSKALSIYDICISIVKREIKDKLKHPFKSQD